MDLSILIPSRNEMFLGNTIENLLQNIRGNTEIIVTLDGSWPVEPIRDAPQVTLLYHPQSVGQRAATNHAARIARGKYVMKLDAHCAVGEGFDVIMLNDMQDDWTMVPTMYNLHAFDWVCKDCGWRKYQGPTPDGCGKCGGTNLYRDILWKAKHNPETTAMRFDSELHFQYWRAYKKRQHGDLVETMSLLGACWMLTLEKYWELNICDEGHGSWGQQGTEVACKTWLSGGKLICNKKTWFAHMFRTQGGDFGFPYKISGSDVRKARDYSRQLWMPNGINEMPAWDKAIHPLSWLIEKFAPVQGWEDNNPVSEPEDTVNIEAPEDSLEQYKPEFQKLDAMISLWSKDHIARSLALIEDEERASSSWANRPSSSAREAPTPSTNLSSLTKGIVYYTDSQLDPLIADACRTQLISMGIPIVSVSLKPLSFGDNIVLEKERGTLTMFEQILAGLEASKADIIFFAEHDVLYHKSHFEFAPQLEDVIYYNENVWKLDWNDGRALFYYCRQTSGLCAYRTTLIEHYKKRIELVKKVGFSRRMGYEPGSHHRPERVDDLTCERWLSRFPNVDIRHSGNLTRSRWKKSEFRNQRYTEGWTEAREIPGWGPTDELLRRLK